MFTLFHTKLYPTLLFHCDWLFMNIIVTSHFIWCTFVDEWWRPRWKRKSLYCKSYMISWWVFMLDQKAVWILLEDRWSAKHLVLPALNLCLVSFSLSLSLLQQLSTYSDSSSGLFVSCCFPLLHALWSSWRGQTSCLDPESWIWLSAEVSATSGGPKKSIANNKKGVPTADMHVYYFESLLNGCADGMLHVLHHPQVVPRGTEGNRFFFFYSCNVASVSQGYKSWASQRS